ncbi:helix-turn-helix domain-containing protein [Streptomyces sp. WM4235]|uniref:helix-turn-helix domain-containing protein n=1 Tax=Streptomyces sp. WM4235 TaxID=1415551 RepID=UPI00099C6653
MRAIRKAQNMSLRTLALVTGLDRGYLSRLERGLIRCTSASSVMRVANAFGVPPEAITHEEKP